MIYEFERRFSMAHRLLLADTSPKCQVPHGHNEYVRARLFKRRPKDGLPEVAWGASNMPVSFAQMKSRWHEWIDEHVDHAFQLNAEDPLVGYFAGQEPSRLKRVMTFPGDPTTEALACAMFLKLKAFARAEGYVWDVASVSIEETPTNMVIVEERDVREFEAHVHQGYPDQYWFNRRDMSINDFGHRTPKKV